MFSLIEAHQLNIMLGLSSVCMVVGFFALITKSLPKRRKHAIAGLEFSSAILLYCDRLAYMYHGDMSLTGYWMVRITNFFVFFMTISVVHGFNQYIYDLGMNEMGLTKTPFRLRLVEMICGIGWFMVILSQFIGLYYYFDENNCYQRGPGFLICYIIPFLALLIQLTFVFQYAKRVSLYISIPMILFTVVPMAASIFQALFYGISLTNMSIVGMGIVLYVFAIMELNDKLEKTQKKKLEEVESINRTVIRSFEQISAAIAKALDAKDKYTRGHSMRVAQYSKDIAKALGMSEEECTQVYNSAMLHDIGKINIPDSILLKRGYLTDAEKESLEDHTVIGGEILSMVDQLPYLKTAALYHHERYDGKGYPEGLKGENIPVIARIVAVTGAYDEMSSFAPDRHPMAQGKIREILTERSGIQYDPKIVDIMVDMIDKDTEYMLREAEDNNIDDAEINDITVVDRMHFDNYKELVSNGIRISGDFMKIRFDSRPDEGFERKNSLPSIILFDSFDKCVHRNERSIRNLRYLEYGEIWMDGHTTCTAARDIRAEVNEKKSMKEADADEWISYEIEAVSIGDHVKVKISNRFLAADITIALPDATRFVYFGLTGEHCSVRNISVKEIPFANDGSIDRIAPEVSFFTRKDGDVKNIEIDDYRAASTPGVAVEDGMRIFFRSQSLPVACLVHHCACVVLFTSDDGNVDGKNYVEYACIRMDGEDATNEEKATSSAKNKLTVHKSDDFAGWDAFKEINKKGLDYEIDFSRIRNKITFKTENTGLSIECTTTVPKGADNVYVAISGDLCVLMDIRYR